MKLAVAALAVIASALAAGVVAPQPAHAGPTAALLGAAAAAERDCDPVINGSMEDAARIRGVGHPLLDTPTREPRKAVSGAAAVAASADARPAPNAMLLAVDRSRSALKRLVARR